eukprot:tig00000169_g11911.t1
MFAPPAVPPSAARCGVQHVVGSSSCEASGRIGCGERAFTARSERREALAGSFLGERPARLMQPNREFSARPARAPRVAPRSPSRPPAASAAEERAGAVDETSLAGLLRGKERKFVFVGGKGGVGKTSTSAALAIRLADEGHSVLVVSTDPAHSLSDALDQDVSGGEPVAVRDAAGVYAMEVDPEEAIAEFKRSLGLAEAPPGGEKSRAQSVLETLGVGDALSAASLGGLLDDIPPGTDEVVALSKVLQFLEDDRFASFDRVVIDTAPTGHTLRLLSFPQFIDEFMGKVLKLRGGIEKAAAAVKAVFAARGEAAPAAAEDTVAKIEAFQGRMRELQRLFRDPARTRFLVVTIATEVAGAETERLVASLRREGVPVHNLVVNQVVPAEAGEAFGARWAKGQARVLASLDRTFPGVEVVQVPLMDAEVRGLYPLRFLGRFLRGPEPEKRNLEALVAAPGRRYVFVGGKGGVGKTSTAAALAIQLADAGHRTLVVSTDPAHSLADALEADLAGGRPVRVDEALFALELDPQEALDEFKQARPAPPRPRRPPRPGSSAGGGSSGRTRWGARGRRPPGARGHCCGRRPARPAPPRPAGAAASSEPARQIVGFLEEDAGAAFDRVVFDTAPTGHTLRLLSFPDFLDGFVGRHIIRLRDKIGAISNAVKSVFGKEVPKGEGAMARLERFQARMQRLQNLFRDGSQCEFVVVSIPTVLAASESERLVAALRREGIAVRTAVVNQVVPAEEAGGAGAAAGFAQRVARQHARTLEHLRTDPALAGLQVIAVPYFDAEVRGVYGLRSLAAALLPPPAP